MKFNLMIENYDKYIVLMYYTSTKHYYIAFYESSGENDSEVEFKEVDDWGFTNL